MEIDIPATPLLLLLCVDGLYNAPRALGCGFSLSEGRDDAAADSPDNIRVIGVRKAACHLDRDRNGVGTWDAPLRRLAARKRNGSPQRRPVSCQKFVDTVFALVCRGLNPSIAVGWASTPSQAMNAAYNPSYDQNVYGGVQGQAGVKAGVINLLSAVRTVMRSAFALIVARVAASTDVRSAVPLIGLNIVVIIYQLLLG